MAIFRRSLAASAAAVLIFLALPAAAAPRDKFVGVSAGYYHACAVIADFRVACWGGAPASTSVEPYIVPGLTRPVQLVSGEAFTCALLQDATVWCWGSNQYGQLGDGTFNPHSTPGPVYGGRDSGNNIIPIKNVVAIAAGDYHACAVKVDGTVRCWGSNQYGQLGNFQVGVPCNFNNPIIVVVHDPDHGNPPLTGVASIAAGGKQTCATFTDSTAACWGDNEDHQLGNPGVATYVDSPVPVLDGGGHPFGFAGNFDGGWISTCALAPDISGFNSAACWGSNASGQVGNDVGSYTDVPAAVLAPDHTTKLTNLKKIATGDHFACALGNDTTAACWGDDTYGQLGTTDLVAGTGVRSQWWLKVKTGGFVWDGFSDLSLGGHYACAVRGNDIDCWGADDFGQLGQGTTSGLPDSFPQQIHTAGLDLPIFADGFGATWHD